MAVFKWFMLIVSIAALVIGFAVSNLPSGASVVHTDYSLWVDASASVNAGDMDRLVQLVENWLIPGIKTGDSILVFQIGEGTGEMPPLFQLESTYLRHGAPFQEVSASRREMAAMRTGTLAAVRRGISGKAKSTEILASFPRIQPKQGRRSVAVYITDALECSETTNLEKLALQDADLSQVIAETRSKLSWDKPIWNDLDVHFILPAPESGQPGLNSMKDLRQYWEAMIQPLGGHLVQFDSFARVQL